MNDNYEDLLANVMDSFDMSYNPLHINNTSYPSYSQIKQNNNYSKIHVSRKIIYKNMINKIDLF